MVTGGSGGIGQACVRTLEQDHNVVIQYNTNKEAAESLKDELNTRNQTSTITCRCDLTDFRDIERMFDYIRDQFGETDVLINNAAVLLNNSLENSTSKDINRELNVNLRGTIYCTKMVLPSMRSRGNGRIIGVSSSSGIRGSPSDPIYGASKGGMIAFIKSLARSHTQDGIFSNVVAPSATDTKMYADERRPKAKEEFPLGRLIRPEEVAEAVRFLATTSSISGEVLEVDAGRYF